MEKIYIAGAGLSGMIAAINLSKKGYDVLVLEKAKTIGGFGPYHPSLHVTPLDMERVASYIGFDIRDSFQKAEQSWCYFNNKRYIVKSDEYWCVERGSRKSSIDTHLYNIAIEHGVKFEFNQNIKVHKDLPPGSIIATGHFPEMYDSLRVPSGKFFAYGIRFKSEKPNEFGVMFNNLFGDYFYHVIMNGMGFGLVFQRSPMSLDILKKCKDILMEREGYPDNEWIEMSNRTPLASFWNPRLFAEDKILTGNIAGMFDPLMMFGIAGAIFSGKVSAMAVYEREKALSEFKTLNKNWKRAYLARKVIERMPFRNNLMEAAAVALPKRIRALIYGSDIWALPGVKGFPVIDVLSRQKVK